MKRGIGVLLLLCSFSVNLLAVEREEFESIVNFALTLQRLDAAAQRGIPLWEDDRLVILDGSVGSVLVVDTTPDTFLAEMELVRGQWRGMDEVVMFRCIVELRGSEFASLFSTGGRSRRPNPTALRTNTPVVVVGTITGMREDPEAGTAYVVDCVELRVVQ